MPSYAARTSVPTTQSREEIERTLSRYGASKFMYGWDHEAAVIAFFAHERYIRFKLPMPDRDSREFTHHARGRRTDESAERQYEQATRQRWRALLLVVKAKLEAVETGITDFEDEFLAYVVMPDNRTLSEVIRPEVALAYESGEMPQLALPSPRG